jgi:hypothetical protein
MNIFRRTSSDPQPPEPPKLRPRSIPEYDPRPTSIPQVKEGRVNSPVRWSPYVRGIVIRHIPHIRVCRLDGDRRPPTLVLSRDGLVRRRTESPFGRGFGAYAALLSSRPLAGPETRCQAAWSSSYPLCQVGEHIGESHQRLYTGSHGCFFASSISFEGLQCVWSRTRLRRSSSGKLKRPALRLSADRDDRDIGRWAPPDR